jgi:hypothetical protein
MLFLSAIPGNPYLRSTLWVSKGRSVLQSSREQQKWASAPHFRPGFSLQVYIRANFAERNEIPRAEKVRKDAAKFGPRVVKILE